MSSYGKQRARFARFCLVLTLAAAIGPSGVRVASAQEPNGPGASTPWYERFSLSGDFRARYEGFYQADRARRHRTRLRLRLRLDAEVNADTAFHLQVASGDPGTPASTNQTLTSFFQPKAFNLDRAYVAYVPPVASAVTLGIGKFPPPQARTQLLFDDDLNFEGGWEAIDWQPTGTMAISLVALQTAVSEASGGSDAYLLAACGSVSWEVGPHAVQLSAANYGWGQIDAVAVAQTRGTLTSILTNATRRASDGTVAGYASRFNVVDVIGEATLMRDAAYPLRVLVELAWNTRAATDRRRGVWIEAEYGRPQQAGQWTGRYTFGWIEQDVTPSAFVFSDMPGTNLWLQMIQGGYVVRDGLRVNATLHLSRRLEAPPGAANRLLSRVHTAAVVRF